MTSRRLADPDPGPVFVPAIVDLAGDPMIINIGNAPGDLPKTRDVARPEKLLFPGISDEITVLADTMLELQRAFHDDAALEPGRLRLLPGAAVPAGAREYRRCYPHAGAAAPLEAPAETPALQAPAEEVRRRRRPPR